MKVVESVYKKARCISFIEFNCKIQTCIPFITTFASTIVLVQIDPHASMLSSIELEKFTDPKIKLRSLDISARDGGDVYA